MENISYAFQKGMTKLQFSPADIRTRLALVQHFLLSSANDGNTCADAILCVLGIDSRYNNGAFEFANYLLCGFFVDQQTNVTRSGIQDEVFDDIMLLVRVNSVDIYCNPINYAYLLPCITHWPNLKVHCLQPFEYLNGDVAEEFKINSLVNMTYGCRIIGIPYSVLGQSMPFDKMVIEKWPVIQAFALEDFGGGGFFTMKYEVIDVGKELDNVYSFVDKQLLNKYISQQLPAFNKQWNTCLSLIDMHSCNKEFTLTEEILNEPLLSFYEHGRLKLENQATNENLRLKENLPFVHIYKQSNETNGSLSGRPTHLVIHAVAPSTSLSCTRTYFFNRANINFEEGGGKLCKQTTRTSSTTKITDTELLMRIYVACIDAVLAAIKMFSTSRNLQKAKTEAENIFWKSETLSSIPTLSQCKVMFAITAHDKWNRKCDENNDIFPHFVKLAEITVSNIVSAEKHSAVLSPVSFAESFIESVITVQPADDSSYTIDDFIVITSQIARMLTWAILANEYSTIRNVLSHSNEFGDLIISGEPVVLHVSNNQQTTVEDGIIYVWKDGLAYVHQRIGLVIMHRSDMAAVSLYDGDSPSTIALLCVDYREHVYVPESIVNENHQMSFAFIPKSRAFKLLVTKVMSLWKQTEALRVPELQLLPQLPDNIVTFHSDLQHAYDKLHTVTGNVSSILIQAQLRRFERHFEVGSILDLIVPEIDLEQVMNPSESLTDSSNSENELRITVTIINGLPDSRKMEIASSVLSLCKNRENMAIIKQPLTSIDLNIDYLHQSLTNVWKTAFKQQSLHRSNHHTVLFVTPGVTETSDVVLAMLSHPDPRVAESVQIGAVVICINQDNALLIDHMVMPCLLDYCTAGWPSVVVFTGLADVRSAQSEQVQKIIRTKNSHVSLFYAREGVIARINDLDLVLSSTIFNENRMVRCRHFYSPNWWLKNGKSNHQVLPCLQWHYIAVTFHKPLDKVKLKRTLKKLKPESLKYPFDKYAPYVEGFVQVVDKSVEDVSVYKLCYITATDSLLLKSKHASDNSNIDNYSYLIFWGFNLNREILEEWITGCLPDVLCLKPKRLVSDLTNAEISKIHKDHHLDQLPEGWFYNGSHYLNIDGSKSMTHPRLKEFLEEYVMKENEGVERHNHCVSNTQAQYLFTEDVDEMTFLTNLVSQQRSS